jgi:hypothetical protein
MRQGDNGDAGERRQLPAPTTGTLFLEATSAMSRSLPWQYSPDAKEPKGSIWT